MPKDVKSSEPREFLVVSLPENAEPGATMRLLGVARTQVAAEKVIQGLDPGTLGRIAVVERKALFNRQAAVETVAIEDAIVKR